MNKGFLQKSKYGRSIMAILLSLAMIVTTVSVSDLMADAASKPAFQKSKFQLTKGETVKLKVKKMPKGAKIVKTKWKVKKKSVLKVTLSGSKAKKKKATTAKVKALTTGKSKVYCTVTYRVKKGGKWNTKKNKVKATVTVASDSKTTAAPIGNPGTTNPDGDANSPGNTANPGDSTNPPEDTAEPGDATNPPDSTTDPGDVANPSAEPGDSTNPPAGTEEPGDATSAPTETEEPGTATSTPVPTATPTPDPTPTPEVDVGNHDFSKTALEFSKELKFGWNLGNTLDAIMNSGAYVSGSSGLNAETAWGNPKAKEGLIKAVKEAGFNTIRVPVTWTNHTDPNNNYQIDEKWMDRVEQVVQYCTSNGLYVLLDVHHDGNDDTTWSNAWLGPDFSDTVTMKARYQRIWEQIATRFKDYSNLVLFESMNEFHHGYGSPTQAYYNVQNELHQIFVDTVRETGGNNASRYLVIPGYNTNIDQTIAGLKLPTDSCEDHLMVEVHYYDPFDFAGDDHTVEQWGSDYSSATATSGWGQEQYLMTTLKKMKTNYVDKGIPVVLGEFGATARTDSANEKYRLYYLQYVVKYCAEYGLVPVYWDNGFDFKLFNRSNYKVVYPDIVDGMMAALEPGYKIPIP